MSRIGKSPIKIPKDVTVELEGNIVTVKGKLGELTQEIKEVTLRREEDILHVELSSNKKEHKAFHGLYRALINNMVEGVSNGFVKQLELVGVGYRASSEGQVLDLTLGFSHSISLEIVPNVQVETITEKGKNPIVKLTSYDKQLLGLVANKIKSLKKVEPYKGKGIRYLGEKIRTKQGKTA
ncbi:50S ribosomal protein L6 [Ichthyobacterium seriolicida]|uniref:50S ribosomal protein L6 n=1 Tax=Ichthyobacterium seriolicida TaxID=242600 RepID=A0A1J1DY64_9FLAO|nr:50S ribosomal protein L6 [Ichthyobacterium seriolicida]BAV94823.1 50S ribosomal protein L6 [Ichthyobacterium seriolicida]